MPPPNRDGTAFDAVTLEVIWTRLISVVDEASAALVRTSFSTLVRESYDFSCIVTDRSGRCIGQATDSIPSFIGTLPKTVRHFLDHFPAETLAPGDVLITNDPWMGTGHLPDLTIAKPLFRDGSLMGFAASTSHAPDMGGRTGTTDIRDVFEEGLQVPMLKLMDAGKVDQTFIAMLRSNVRVPELVVGDLFAQVSAVELVERRLFELMNDYGLTELDGLADEILARSEAAMRTAIRAFPDGVYDYKLETRRPHRTRHRPDPGDGRGRYRRCRLRGHLAAGRSGAERRALLHLRSDGVRAEMHPVP